jgi:carboxypeptidase PM20D1
MGYVVVAILAFLVFFASFIITRTIAAKAGKPLEILEPTPVQGDEEGISNRLAGAIRYKTIAYADQDKIDGSQFLGLHEYLKVSYPTVAEKLKWEVVKDYSLLLTWKGQGGDKPAALLAHMDVVPVTPGTEADWTHEAFSGEFDGEYVWGRGTMDMKGHLITVLEAVEGLLKDGFQPQSDVYLCFGHNEELVSAPASGAKAIMELLKAREIKLDTIIDEGGVVIPGQDMLGIPGLLAVIGTAEKGYMDVSLTCAQDGGHSSQPPQTTALGILATALAKMEKNPMKPQLIGTVERMLTMAGRYMGFSKRMIFSNLWLFKPVLLKSLTAKPLTNALVRTTFAATMASGSTPANVLPQKAEIVANMRLLPGETMESALQKVTEVIGDDRVKVSLMKGKNPSAESSIHTDGYRLIKSTLEELYPGILVIPYLMVGGTDSCLYEPVCDNIYRIAPFMISNDEMKTIHGTNERISKMNLARGAEFFSRVITHLS